VSHKSIIGELKICTVAAKKVNSMPEHIFFSQDWKSDTTVCNKPELGTLAEQKFQMTSESLYTVQLHNLMLLQHQPSYNRAKLSCSIEPCL